MIYSRDYEFAFVHIPRCAGLFVTASLARQCFRSVVLDTAEQRHAHAAQLRSWMGDVWYRSFRFAVIRNPWRIIESDYRLCLGTRPLLSKLRGAWQARVGAAAAGTFAAFVEREYLQGQLAAGGFWSTWIGTEAVEPVVYDALPARWVELNARIRAVDGPAPLTRINEAPDIPPEWTPALIERVRVLCAEDIRRFDFPDRP